MIGNLALAAVMVGLTVTIHFCGLLALVWTLRRTVHRFRPHESAIGQGAAIVLMVLGLVGIHTVEIWAYGVTYLALGALPDLEAALYFSTGSFTTMGYGDIVLDRRWRLFGAIEGANGLLLFGWSTAFLFSVTGRLRTFEHEWLERAKS
jgi:hypothetical protein